MRFVLVLLTAAGIMACDRSPEEPANVVVASKPPHVSFEGGDYKDDIAKVFHGERLTKVLGCTGCHGAGLQGKRFYEPYASNLTRDLVDYSDADIERAIRDGVPRNRRDLWGMPSEIFQHLSEPDMAALIAYLRTFKPAGPPTQPRLPFPPEVEKMIADGKLKPAAAFVRESKAKAPVELGASHALGRYIARVTCAECHGADLKGGQDIPDLIVAGSYNLAEFERLMTQGIPTGDRKLKPLMADVAKSRFSHLTSRERDALYAYLKARADQPQ